MQSKQIIIIWRKKPFMKTIRQRFPFKVRIVYILWLGVVCYGIYFSLYQILRFQTYKTSLDLVSVEQPLWNTLHGQFLRTTYYPATGEVIDDFINPKTESLLGDHVQPSLLLLLPFYALSPRPETLMVIMSLAIGFGAIPLFRIVHRRIGSERWALAFSMAYLLLPAVQTNSAHDIHMANLLPPLLLASLDALESGHLRWCWFWALLAMGCREDVPLLVGWAMFVLAPKSKRLDAGFMLVVGLILSILSIWVIIPNFGSGSSYLLRYVPLGAEISSSGLLSLVKNPHFLLNELVRFLSYNLRLGMPFLFLYVFSPPFLLAIAPTIIMNGLSWYDVSLYPNLAHYSAVIIGFVLVGSVDGLVRLTNALAKKKSDYNWRGIIGVALFTSIGASHLLTGYSPLSLNFKWPLFTGREDAKQNALSSIPSNASVSAETGLAGHLARRSTLRFFPDMREVDWVIVDAWTGRYPYYQPISGVMHIWQSLLSDPSWETAYARDGLIVLKRGSGPPKAVFSAFQPSPDIELSPLKVHFGVKGQGMNLVGLAIFPASFDILLLCSDWEILQAGDAQPLLGLKHGEIFQNSEPLASTGFLPNLFTQNGKVRDCTSLNTRFMDHPIEARFTVAEGNQQMVATLHSTGDWANRLLVENDTLIVQIQP